MLYGIGLTEEDLNKAQVGIVSMGYEEIHVICTLTKDIKQGLEGRFSRTYFLIGVSDGMSNGTDGMRFH
jgi:dihydroxy-acid dehydratase